MANRKERRFIIRELMRKAGIEKVNDPKHYDSVNRMHRSFFAMHWRHWPNLKVVDILPRHEPLHTKRNLSVKRKKEAMA